MGVALNAPDFFSDVLMIVLHKGASGNDSFLLLCGHQVLLSFCEVIACS
jgi:hypothetical protein